MKVIGLYSGAAVGILASFALIWGSVSARSLAADDATDLRAGSPVPMAAGKLTPSEAVDIIARKIGRAKARKTHLVYDHSEERAGRKYLVIHGYDIVDEHTATWGWFFVDAVDGRTYQWDLAEDKLLPF